MASTSSIGWAENVRPPGGGLDGRVLARQPPLPDRRVGQRHHAELAAAVEQADPPGIVRRSENSIWLLASRRPRLRKRRVDRPRLLGRVVGDADRLAPVPRRARPPAPRPARRASAARSGRGSGTGRWRRPPSRSSECRAAESSAPWTFTFHGLGMNFVARTTRLRTPGSAAKQPPDDALALAAAVDLGRVEEDDPGLDAGLPGVADRRLGERLVVAAHAPHALVAPRPRADPERRDRDVGPGQRDPIARLRRRGAGHRAARRGVGPGEVRADGALPLTRHGSAAASGRPRRSRRGGRRPPGPPARAPGRSTDGRARRRSPSWGR